MSSKKAATVGYKYYMGIHAIACHGPVDKFSELIVGERSAWSGSLTASGTVSVNKPTLFGGETREGGVIGDIDVMFGEPTQAQNNYLLTKIGSLLPAYRGLLSFVFRSGSRGFMWSMMNPYFKSPWFRVTRVLNGWSRGTAWYAEKAYVGSYDMNPAHMIYECYTDREWGMGYSPDDLDDANFRAAADALWAEGFGLSMMWMNQDSIEGFIDEILRHIDGARRFNPRTGKIQLKLIRDDYDTGSLPELNKSNIKELSSFQRSAWADVVNEVVVNYTDREQNVVPLVVQNLAAIEAQNGAVVSTTKSYPGIRTPQLASRVASRDLQAASTPSAKISLVCNRIAWDWFEGDVFKLTWEPLGINGVPFRIISINKGNIGNGEIAIEAVEDNFSVPDNGYLSTTTSGWVDPRTAPTAVTVKRLVEAPYWDIVRAYSASDFDYLQPLWAFGQMLAVAPNAGSQHFILAAGGGTTYDDVAPSQFVATAILPIALPAGAANVVIDISATSERMDIVEQGDYCYIDNEALGVVSVSDTSVTLSRGVIDTVPAAHSIGARMYFVTDLQAHDPTERSQGETTYYRNRTVTALGILDVGVSPTDSITFSGRAHNPYPPGNLKINGQAYPAQVLTTDGVSVSWSHRDRLQQTVDLVPTSTGNIGPEPGTTYGMVVRNGSGAILGSYSGVTSPFTVPAGLTSSPGTLVVEIGSYVAGRTSSQVLNHRFDIVSP